jgi:hypothetical protein
MVRKTPRAGVRPSTLVRTCLVTRELTLILMHMHSVSLGKSLITDSELVSAKFHCKVYDSNDCESVTL